MRETNGAPERITVVAGSDVHFGCYATFVSNQEVLVTSQTRLNKKTCTRQVLLFNGAPERVEPLKNCTAILGGTPGKLCLKGRKSEREQNERSEWRAREDSNL